MREQGFTIEAVDRLTGPLIGQAKTATFRTIDMVGLDVFTHVAQNIYDNAPADPQREIFQIPDFMRSMLQKKLLGIKTGSGFYKKMVMKSSRSSKLDYRKQQRANLPDLK
jgi:3-hydroxyacyl-CoA dehydrogenase